MRRLRLRTIYIYLFRAFKRTFFPPNGLLWPSESSFKWKKEVPGNTRKDTCDSPLTTKDFCSFLQSSTGLPSYGPWRLHLKRCHLSLCHYGKITRKDIFTENSQRHFARLDFNLHKLPQFSFDWDYPPM